MSKIKFSEHPEYTAMSEGWTVYRDLYDGEHAKMVSPSYLWVHEFEQDSVKGGTKLREIRERRTRYVNLVKPLVNRYVSLIFKNPINIDEVTDLFGDHINDVDGYGTSLENFIKRKITQNTLLYGRPYILTDSFSIDARSKGEAQGLGHRPFWEVLHPLDVRDWQRETSDADRLNNYNFLRCQYMLIEDRVSAMQSPKQFWYTKVMSVEDGNYVIRTYKGAEVGKGKENEDWTLDSEIEISELSEIPIASFNTESWVKDVTPIALRRHNLQSALDNQLNMQGYQRLIGSGDFEDGDGLVMNEATVTLIKGDLKMDVIQPSQPTSLEQAIESSTSDFWRVAFSQPRAVAGDSKGIQSWQTIREANEDFINLAVNLAKDIQSVTNQAVHNWALFEGKDNFEGEVKFDLDITTEDITELLAMGAALADRMNRHPEWRRQWDLKMAQMMNLSDYDAVKEEINDSQTTQEDDRAELLRLVVNGE